MSANIKIEDLGDCLRHGVHLAAICRCGHIGVLDRRKLWRYYLARGWSTRKHRVHEHIYCSKCRRRPAQLRVTHMMPQGPAWGPQTDAEWKQLVKAMRG